MKSFKKYIPIALLVTSLGLGFNVSYAQNKAYESSKKTKIVSVYEDNELSIGWIKIEKILPNGMRVRDYRRSDGLETRIIDQVLPDGTKIKQIDFYADGKVDWIKIEKRLPNGIIIKEYRKGNSR